jgi:NADH:ubiquinone oxidoreductase subunit K
MTVVQILLFLAFFLAGIGLYGLLTLRHLIKLVIALQVLGKSAVIALVIAGYSVGKVNLGQSLAVMVIVVDTIVAVIGLALALQIQRQFGTLDASTLASLKK